MSDYRTHGTLRRAATAARTGNPSVAAWIAGALTETDVPEFMRWFHQTQLEAD